MDKDQLGRFYHENVTQLYRFFFFKTYSVEIAQDLTSESFLSFVDRAKELDPQSVDFKKYLYGIARNIFANYLRKKYKEAIFISADQDFEAYVEEVVDKNMSSPTLEERLRKFLDQLPDSQRTVSEMRFIQKMSLKEISIALGKDMNYVKTTQKRAIHSLKRLISCTP